MKRFAFAAVLLLIPAGAFAVDFGVRIGKYSDIAETFVGAEAVFHLGRNLTFNPSLEYHLTEGLDLFTAYGELDYNFRPGERLNPYLGVGVGTFYLEGGGEGLLSFTSGVEVNLGETFKPYGQVRYFRGWAGGIDDVGLMLGLRFPSRR